MWVRQMNLGQCMWVLLQLWLFSIVPGLLWHYRNEIVCHTNKCQSTLWCALDHNPLAYLHVIVPGIIGAQIFVHVCMHREEGRVHDLVLRLDRKKSPMVFKFGIVIGYSIYFLLAFFLHPHKWFMSWHNRALLPVMLLVLTGTALGADPIAKYIFKWPIFIFLGRTSHVQCLIELVQLLLPFALVASAFAIERLISRPYAKWQLERQEEGKSLTERCIAHIDREIDMCLRSRLCILCTKVCQCLKFCFIYETDLVVRAHYAYVMPR